MRRFIVLSVLICTIITGCSTKISGMEEVNQDKNISHLERTELDLQETREDNKDNSIIEEIDSNGSTINYELFTADMLLEEVDIQTDKEILFDGTYDMNHDGYNERIIAVGDRGDMPIDTYITRIYVLLINNDTIKLITEISNIGGYSLNDVDVINLQGQNEQYLYCGITNSVSMLGFGIYGYKGEDFELIDYSASPVGVGNDTLMDYDDDGLFDGYIQNRWSYDVLYYSTIRKYLYDGANFYLSDVSIEIPEYPTNIEDTIIQYLTLKELLAMHKVDLPEVKERLSHMCINGDRYNVDKLGYMALVNTINGGEDGIELTIEINSDEAYVIATFQNEYDDVIYKYEFNLNNINEKWYIENIQLIS